ncbi:NAD(P)/FAD-dependent oxidoreductase [Alteromonas sp. 1_MG-2023]|uniref:flavin monoamine oxidase family protein n=1 Tax=Alteromonas sp. 1_MG-2023 TaxID=3062669 RepID=UPI0026E3A1C1|nr:NAD(P)/FAD-dependent oxidoreductase [Alteromonas sp. 1_MG-2023]MDO6475203.1 NAD(P)/FAD-dependent oxidoreductase [Alteromonas sp. 1_MG-2023]
MSNSFDPRFSRRGFLKGSALVMGSALFPAFARASGKTDVTIIGAGLSGLYAASLLEQSGLTVRVLEGRNRIGGRLYTLDDVPGAPEAGGQTIGPNYGRMIFNASRVGVPLNQVDFGLGNEPVRQVMQVAGQRVLPADWATCSGNPFPDQFKAMTPDQLLPVLLGKPPFSQGNDWLSDSNFNLDIPVSQLLREKGLSAKAIEMLGAANNYGRTLDESSLLFLYRNNYFVMQSMQTPGGVKMAQGGNQRVPEAMAKHLSGEVLTGKVAAKIKERDSGITVRCDDGSEYESQYVLSSVPFSTLRHVEIDAPLHVMQREAINELEYGKVYQAHFEVVSPFWEGKGFLPNVWSDSVIERVFASDPSQSGKITNLTVWINGKGVEAVEKLSEKDAAALIQKSLYEALPEAKGAVKFVRLFNWQDSPMSRGSFATWKPGQVARYANVMATPTSRLHFCGEHTAQWASGMEGALESGERAANEILTKV